MGLEPTFLSNRRRRAADISPAAEPILDRTALRGRAWLTWFPVPLTALAAAVAAWLLVVPPGSDSFTAKRYGKTGALDVACDRPSPGPPSAPATSKHCRAGRTLLFVVNTSVVSGTLGAYAERVDAPGGDRIWYFPTKTGFAPAIAPGAGTVVLPDGVRLGPEHRPGHYRVTAWISDRPIARTEIDRSAPALFRTRSAFYIDVER